MRTGGEERRFWIARAPRFPATTAKCLREPFSKALGAPGSRAREDGRLKCRFRATLESGSPPLLTYIPLFAPLSCLLPPISPPFSLHFTVSSSSTASSSLRLLPCRPTRRRLSLSLSFNFGFAQTSPLHLSRYIPFAWVGTYPWRKCT